MILADETYFDLVTNVPHVLFELTWEMITGVVVYPFIRWGVKLHDRRKHGIHT